MLKRMLLKINLFLLLCVLGGCRKEVYIYQNDLIAINRTLTYETNNVEEYTVSPNGDVFTYGLSQTTSCKDYGCNDSESSLHNGHRFYYLKQYDIDGNLLLNKEIDGNVYSFKRLATDGETLFFAATDTNEGAMGISLFTYNLQSDEVERLTSFKNMEEVNSLIYSDGVLYIITRQTYEPILGTAVSSGGFVTEYASRGEKLFSYTIADKKTHQLPIKQPITMALCEDNSLLINCYDDSQGFLMIKYNTQMQQGEVVAQNLEGKVTQFSVCNNDQSILYTYDSFPRGLVMSPIDDWSVEAEIHPIISSRSTHDFGSYYVRGHVYLVNDSLQVERFSIRDAYHNYRTIQYISAGNLVSEPFGAGYTMKRLVLDDAQFVLKVLARDKDFDIAVMSSSSSASYDIAQAGFYPLNDISRIDEYLDRCFPYVREAVTNDNGDIWMLPVAIDIPSFMVDENQLKSKSVNLQPNMTYDEFARVFSDLPKELYYLEGFRPYALYQSIASKYFHGDATKIDHSKLSSTMLMLQNEYPNWISRNNDIDYYQQEFLYENIINLSQYSYRYDRLKDTSSIRTYPLPKVETSDPNYGYCTFIVVNTESDKIDDIKDYIADYIQYIMSQENTPLWFQDRVNPDLYWESVHNIYRDGKIVFTADYDVWRSIFYDTLQGVITVDSFITDIMRKMDVYYNE